jgi:hypothetical protein
MARKVTSTSCETVAVGALSIGSKLAWANAGIECVKYVLAGDSEIRAPVARAGEKRIALAHSKTRQSSRARGHEGTRAAIVLTVNYGKGAQRGAQAGPRGTWSPSTMSLCWGLSGNPAAGYQ